MCQWLAHPHFLFESLLHLGYSLVVVMDLLWGVIVGALGSADVLFSSSGVFLFDVFLGFICLFGSQLG